ncbi:glutamate receptor ionotropic, kainate glr-3-like [Bacillus rossius redtenbacheri]|uniref:glutamate receptor ionotropic, kainate glr-3-like n=1 Tax=Bacillus rossius redtenbacheri TaxID=93214 RepID=UPI002FDE80B0
MRARSPTTAGGRRGGGTLYKCWSVSPGHGRLSGMQAGLAACWLLLAAGGGAWRPDAREVAAVVREAALLYDKVCVALVFSGRAGPGKQAALARTARQLSQAGLAAASLQLQATSFEQAGQLCHHAAPLLVLWDADKDTRTRWRRAGRRTRRGCCCGPRGSPRTWAASWPGSTCPSTATWCWRARGPRGGGYRLEELYRVSPGAQIRSYRLGAGRMLPRLLSRYHRRPGLHGLVLRAAFTPKEFVMEEILDESGHKQKIGFFAVFWRTLEDIANFTTKYIENKNRGYGIESHGSWNGMIEMLRKNEVNAAVGDFTMSRIRKSVIDFTIPLITTSSRVFIPAPGGHELNWSSFSSPFSAGLWGWLLGSLPPVATLAWGAQRLGGRERARGWRHGYSYALLSVLRPVCQQGLEDPPRSWSCRAIFLTLYLTMQILYSAYSAALVSSLAKQTFTLPFADIGGLLRDGSYDFYVSQMSAEYELFQTSNDSLMRAVFRRYLQDQSVLPTSSGNILAGLCGERKRAVLQPRFLAEASAGSLPCRVLSLPTAVFQTSLAIALAKHSPYQGIFNHYLMLLLETGIRNKFKRTFVTSPAKRQQESWVPVNMTHVVPILAVLGAGVAAAVVALLLEVCVRHCRSPARPRGPSGARPRHICDMRAVANSKPRHTHIRATERN